MRYILFVLKGSYVLKFEDRNLSQLCTQGARSGQYKITDLDGQIVASNQLEASK